MMTMSRSTPTTINPGTRCSDRDEARRLHVHDDIERVLIDRNDIARRVHELGQEIARDLTSLQGESGTEGQGQNIMLVPVLTGSMIFLADLVRHLPHKLRIGVVSITSYPGKSVQTTGARLEGTIPDDLAGQHVLVIDDIFDSGNTMRLLLETLRAQRPASLRSCVLLRKLREDGRADTAPPDYVGFEIPDEFVVGYGLDYNDYYRNLPDIAILRREAL
ncbi:MAG: hypoxanthine phosphoribosyltransferase [Planctomycetota bacterium]